MSDTTYALVTGANKGLGLTTVRRLAELGWTVLLGARDASRGAAAASGLAGLDVHVLPIDVTSDESACTAAKRVEDSYGRLDVLVNNAGITGPYVAAADTGAGDLRKTYETNVFGPVRVTRAFLPLLTRSAAPRIVMVSSGMGSIAVTSDPSRLESQLVALTCTSSKTALNMITTQTRPDGPLTSDPQRAQRVPDRRGGDGRDRHPRPGPAGRADGDLRRPERSRALVGPVRVAADRPDLLLYDITRYAGRALAHRWNVPLVQLSPSMVAWEGFEEDMGEALAFRRDPRLVEYRERFAAWLDGLGIDLDPDTFSGRPRCVVLIPRALQPHADDVDEKVYTFVGPSLDRRPHQGDWPESEKPLVLVSLGSAYNDRTEFFRACVAAFGPLPWQVVLAIGPHTDPAAIAELPPNVELHRWVPQLAVLRRASAFVTHAGMGGCSEGLHEGVPMIAVSQAVDQFGNAAMLQELGVGVHLRPRRPRPRRCGRPC
ncbi:SDR family NAD(P)-dependent oxidoreductase [Pseudonocardia sp.]|uniref:SDR family NAD(P)-dependent oxidoreductase n=1 Tax=Pseudonocardia sp. TaxID=60912 RepID=UPI0034530D6D